MTALTHNFDDSRLFDRPVHLPKSPPCTIAMQENAAAVGAAALISTPKGAVAAGRLRAGDTILTPDNKTRFIRWVGHARLTPEDLNIAPWLRPVMVRAGSLAGGKPDETLYLAPSTGMLATGPNGDALMTATDLAACDGAIQASPRNGITYVQILLDDHDLLIANGVAVASFHPAILKRNRRNATQVSDILSIFPDMEHGLDLYGEPRLPDLPLREWS